MIVRRREEIEPTLNLYYSALANFMVTLIDTKEDSIILEAGCGSGALTVPLLSQVNYSEYVCYDFYSGVYEHSLQEILEKNLEVALIKGDVRKMSFRSESIDIIISNELLCELTRDDTQKAVAEFYRILKPGGTFIHGVLSPYPENKAQELVILADKYSAEPVFPKEWFSPPADELAGMLHRENFSEISINYFLETVKFVGDIAFETVKGWVTKPEFFEKYSEDLKEYGLEYPASQVVYCRK